MKNLFHRKLTYLYLSAIFGFCIIATRLLYMQIIHGHFFWHRSQKNYQGSEKIVSLRGEIVDHNGILLATNRPVIDIYWQGTGYRSLQNKHLEVLASLENICQTIFPEEKRETLRHAERRRQKLKLYNDLSLEQLGKISELWNDHPNIDIEKSSQRFYPYGNIASHILGYLTSIDNEYQGKMGIENIFDRSLKGTHGTLETIKNSLGITLKHREILPPKPGDRIQTTLDLSFQQLADEAFYPDMTGTLILMDPYQGDIKAIVSRPTFDPNIFNKPISLDTWQQLQEQRPFINRAFNACYPPASIFKLVSLSAAIETGLITQETKTDCRGTITFGRKYGCGRRYGGHGNVNIMETVAHSCNILFYRIGKKIDIDVLMNYAHRFGLGEKTGIILDEKTGLMPTRTWKKAMYGEPWWPGDTLQATIGQTYLLVTPIQISRMISSIFTGYLVTPRLVANEPPTPRVRLRIKNSTRNLLQEAMKAVVSQGTGKDLFPLTKKGFTLYAKTGTGQTSNREKRSLGGKHLEHAWSAVYFSYKNKPPLTLIVLIEHVGGSGEARGCVKRFLTKLAKHYDEQKKDSE